MAARTPQAIAYHVNAVAGGRHRKLGTVFIASSDAPVMIRGRYVFYRLLNSDDDLIMRRDQTTGFSKAVYEKIKADGVEYVAAHSKETGRMLVTHINYFIHTRNYGQGLQARADVVNSVSLPGVPRLRFPAAVTSANISDEEPAEEVLAPRPVQASLPIEEKPVKGNTLRCGCYYENNQIEKPCLSHKDAWEPVLRARAVQRV